VAASHSVDWNAEIGDGKLQSSFEHRSNLAIERSKASFRRLRYYWDSDTDTVTMTEALVIVAS